MNQMDEAAQKRIIELETQLREAILELVLARQEICLMQQDRNYSDPLSPPLH